MMNRRGFFKAIFAVSILPAPACLGAVRPARTIGVDVQKDRIMVSECGEQGKDWEELLEQIAEENTRFKDLGLTRSPLQIAK